MANLTDYLNGMSLEKAWRGDFAQLTEKGMPEWQCQLLRQICENAPADSKAAYDFLAEEDPLFHSIYGDGVVNGEKTFVFPLIKAANPDKVSCVIGPIGTQTSKYHQETVQQHVCMVAANLVDAGFDKDLAVKLAVLHDVGKKYTAATNKVGGVCFYAHAELSAFIAGHWLRQTEDEASAKEIMAIIHGHMNPKTMPAFLDMDYPRKLLAFFGDPIISAWATGRIEAFSECDEGVTEFNQGIYEKIARGEALICN